MRSTLLPGALVALVLGSGCATYADFKREQAPILQLAGDGAGVGLLQVEADDEVVAKAPNDFSNMTGLVSKAIKDYFKLQGTQLTFKDYTDLEYQARFTPNRSSTRIPYTVTELPGVPAGVQSPLVTVVKVLDWRTFLEKDQSDKPVDVARVSLLMSTWTRDGQPVRSEVITAQGRANQWGGVALDVDPEPGRLMVWFKRSDTDQPRDLSHAPKDRTKLFLAALKDAVAVHYYPYFPHEVSERHVIADDELLKPGVVEAQTGRLEQALALWEKVAAENPKSHGAVYNCALVHLVRGDDEKAAELLRQAVAIEKSWLYEDLLASIKTRLDLRKVIGATVQPVSLR